MTRHRLPDRRGAEAFDFVHGERRWTATVGRFPDGAVAEIFINAKPSPLADMVQDAAILASIALQHGASVEVVHHAIAGRGGPLAAALGLINGGAK
jgi:hypothetical protein